MDNNLYVSKNQIKLSNRLETPKSTQDQLLGRRNSFSYPKPVSLIKIQNQKVVHSFKTVDNELAKNMKEEL